MLKLLPRKLVTPVNFVLVFSARDTSLVAQFKHKTKHIMNHLNVLTSWFCHRHDVKISLFTLTTGSVPREELIRYMVA